MESKATLQQVLVQKLLLVLLILLTADLRIASASESKRSKDTTKQKEQIKEEVLRGQEQIKENGKGYSVPSGMPTEHQALLAEQYDQFIKQRRSDKTNGANNNRQQQQGEEDEGHRLVDVLPKKEGFSPKAQGMKRSADSRIELPQQIAIPSGSFQFGSQTAVADKLAPVKSRDGAEPRRLATLRSPLLLDAHEVSNLHFADFVVSTGYITESELFGWSFVLDGQASKAVKEEVDGPQGFGRVKNSPHWMAVKHASWDRPFGSDSDINERMGLPVVHVSYQDAVEYCSWAGRRLPTEEEWEFAARAGRNKQNYPWGNKYVPGRMNIWDGDEFPHKNPKLDGFWGPAPVQQYEPNAYGLYNMLGNVWEWVSTGDTSDSSSSGERTMRGGSFVDSVDGKFNHQVLVSTRQLNTGDSAATNIGFRCAQSITQEQYDDIIKANQQQQQEKLDKVKDDSGEHIEL